MNTTSTWSAGTPVTRALLASLAVASLGFGAIQASPAVAAPPVQPGNEAAQPAQRKPLRVTLNHLNASDPRVEGAELLFSVTVANLNTAADYNGLFTAFPSDSNIDGLKFVQNGTPSCRWQNWSVLAAEQERTCAGDPSKNWKLFHRITAEDVQRGYFEATATYDMTRDGAGTDKLATATTARLRIDIPQGSTPVPPPVAPPPTPQKAIDVQWNRTDDLGEKVYVGDTLTWAVSITNVSGKHAVAYPRSANVDNALVGSLANCRWGDFTVNKHYDCNVFHTVTEGDLKNKQFTPEIQMDLTRDRTGEQVITAGELVKGLTVPITEGTRPPGPKIKDILATPNAHGFTCHRIPALTTAPNGWLLAAWDGRPDNCADSPNPNSIIQWISKDGGASWEEADRKVVAAGKKGAEKYGYSDPSYVVDRENNVIYMFFVKSYDASIWNSQQSTDPQNRNVLHAAVMESHDNGENWTEPEVITADIEPATGAWKGRFAASGEGIQLRYGEHKGRLIQQYVFAATDSRSGHLRHYAVSVYKDPKVPGSRWKAGKPIDFDMDENKVVELSNGDLMVNARMNSTKARKIAISHDGGETYTNVHVDRNLRDPNNNASIIRAFPDAEQGSACAKVLLFSNAFNTHGRSNGMISASLDDGQTWQQVFTIERGNMQYSTLTPLKAVDGTLNSGRYGLLYEAQGPTITHRTVTFDQLQIEDATKHKLLDTCVAKAQTPPPANPAPQPQVPGPVPAPQPTPDARVDSIGAVTRVAGESRVETAVAIAKADFKDGAKVALLARADVHADAAAAVPLAKHLNAPVLLSQPDALHPKALEELKRLKAEQVVIMGGKVAISEKAEAELVKAGFKVERVAGENRAATAVETAKMLAKAGKAKQVLVADGADWQPTMIAGPAAAMAEGVTLLTNGKAQAPETAKYLSELKATPVAIGEAAKAASEAKDAVTAKDPAALSLAVAERFFKQEAPAVGIATTADFADALTGGAHVARRNGPLLLSDTKLGDDLLKWVRGASVSRTVFMYGGETRFSESELARIADK